MGDMANGYILDNYRLLDTAQDETTTIDHKGRTSGPFFRPQETPEGVPCRVVATP